MKHSPKGRVYSDSQSRRKYIKVRRTWHQDHEAAGLIVSAVSWHIVMSAEVHLAFLLFSPGPVSIQWHHLKFCASLPISEILLMTILHRHGQDSSLR